MTAFSFTAPGGRAYMTIRSSNIDPNRRYAITVSDGFGIGADGLRDLAKQIKSYADKMDPPAKAKASSKSKPKSTDTGGAE